MDSIVRGVAGPNIIGRVRRQERTVPVGSGGQCQTRVGVAPDSLWRGEVDRSQHLRKGREAAPKI